MTFPLVSIIIPTYNHAQYLTKAINSIKNQTYSNLELIIIDDGSTDHTKEVISGFDDILYFYQDNAGLSVARNNATKYSKGEFLLFLDADDWLYPDAVRINLEYLLKDPDLFFVSGSHMKVFVDENKISHYAAYDVPYDNFRIILKNHYISHPASVLFRRKVFDSYTFDVKFKSCQDFDLYLTIARNHKVLHHSELVSAYRFHTSNMSSNHAHMLDEILRVMKKHKSFLKSDEDFKAYEDGKQMFINYYTMSLYYNKLRKHKVKASSEEKNILKKYSPLLYIKYIGNSILNR